MPSLVAAMNADQAVARLGEVIQRKHFAPNTKQSYCGWLRRYCQHIATLPADLPSEQKPEQFLTALAKTNIAASTQNQAFNAIVFFYKEMLGSDLTNIQALRAKRPAQLRHAPSRDDVSLLLKTIRAEADFAFPSPLDAI